MKRTINILCTSVGNPAFPSIVTELKKAKEFNFRIIATDIRKEAPGLYLADKSYIVSKLTDKRFLDDIFAIIKADKIDILLPLSTIDQNYFSHHKKIIESKGIRVMVSDEKVVSIANNKYKLYEFLKERNINPLHYTKIFDDKILTIVRTFSIPFVLKNEEGTGGQGTLIVCDNERGIKEDDRKFYLSLEIFNANPELYVTKKTIISEYLPGDEYSVDTLSFNGRFYYAVIRKRFKSVGGLALESTVVHDEDLLKLSKSIVQKLGLSFVNNLQFKMSSSGVYKMMEINPRIPGTIKLSLAAGANMIVDAVRLAMGETKIKISKPAIGTSIFRYWDGAIATPKAIKSLKILHPPNE